MPGHLTVSSSNNTSSVFLANAIESGETAGGLSKITTSAFSLMRSVIIQILSFL